MSPFYKELYAYNAISSGAAMSIQDSKATSVLYMKNNAIFWRHCMYKKKYKISFYDIVFIVHVFIGLVAFLGVENKLMKWKTLYLVSLCVLEQCSSFL